MCVAFILDPQVESDKTKFLDCILKKNAYFSKAYSTIFSSLHNYYANRAPTFIKSPSFNHAIRSIKVAFLFELISTHSNSNP